MLWASPQHQNYRNLGYSPSGQQSFIDSVTVVASITNEVTGRRGGILAPHLAAARTHDHQQLPNDE